MNPILRAAANGLNRSRSEGQIRMEKKKAMQKQKRRQDKEKMRIEGLEREKKWTELGKEIKQFKDEVGPSSEESAAEKFQKELCWCIQNLELGMTNLKPNPKQAQEAERVLRILKSHKTPLAKKRQVMRSTFGDYRGKMQLEEKKHAAAIAKKTGVSSASCETLASATFFRKSVHQRSQTAPAYVPSLSPMKEEVSIAEVLERQESSHEEIPPEGEDEGVDVEEGDAEMEMSVSDIDLHEGETSVKLSMNVEHLQDSAESSPITMENKLLEQIKKGGKVMKKHDSGISSFASFDSSRSLGDISLKQDSESDLSKFEKISPTHSMLSSSRSSDSIYPLTSSSSSRESLLVKSQSCNTFRFNFDIEESDKDKRGVENSLMAAKKDSKKKKIKKGGQGMSKQLNQEETSSSDMLNTKESTNKNVLTEKLENIQIEKDISSGEKTPTIEEVSAGIDNLGKEGKNKKRNRKKKKKKKEEEVCVSLLADQEGEKRVSEEGVQGPKEGEESQPEKGEIELSLGGGGFKFSFENVGLDEDEN